MQAAQVLGGYSLGGADLLRRAMGKKKAEEMAEHREIFRDGAAKKDISAEVADEVFDLMEKFAGYGFNKSHAAAYSLLAYHTAWIKVHCTAEFFAANMTVEIDDTDKLKVLLDRCEDLRRRRRAARRQPRHLPLRAGLGDKSVRYGLGAIKGTGQGAIEAIVAAREEGGAVHEPVRLLRARRPPAHQPARRRGADQGRRVRSRCSRRARRCSPASASRSTGPTRRPRTPTRAGCSTSPRWRRCARREHEEPALVAAEPWSIKERLTLEKAALGFYLSGHLFDQSADEVRRFASADASPT